MFTMLRFEYPCTLHLEKDGDIVEFVVLAGSEIRISSDYFVCILPPSHYDKV